jgi:prepilin-type N-terminal cleavage/methylation domain-containing protein
MKRSTRVLALRGFTLVEMMAVVAIVSILATIAVVLFHRRVKQSRVAEATNIITGIDMGEDAYFSETGHFADISTDTLSTYPRTIAAVMSNGHQSVAWGADCTQCTIVGSGAKGWEMIGAVTNDPVFFAYSVVASREKTPNTSYPTPSDRMLTSAQSFASTAMTFSSSQMHWYGVRAVGNPDGSGAWSGPVDTSGTMGACIAFHQVYQSPGSTQKFQDMAIDCD